MNDINIGNYRFVNNDYEYVSSVTLKDNAILELQLDLNYTEEDYNYVSKVLEEIER